jgi:hypothetical protein
VADTGSRGSRFELIDGPLPLTPEEPSDTVRRPRTGPGILVLVGAAIVMLMAALVLPHPTPDAAPPLPSPSVPAPGASCDLGSEGCRVLVAARWRDRTAQVLRARLDPENVYFTGYSYSANTRYTTGPRLNALGLEIYRLVGGGTEVFVQVARSDADALRCGTVTQHRCVRQRLADGQEFWMTTTDGMQDGIEIQHSPDGTYVITLAARNVRGGSAPAVSYSDLIAVALDPRLRPPPG